jgi:predicted transcriptional regulator
VKLKADDQVHRHVSTTSKSIQKLNVETMEHVQEKPWVSIAKAAECEGIPATKMRYVRDKTNVDGFMYVTV